MDRILRGTFATISTTFYVDGVGTNPTPDTATVHITRMDGTDVVAAGTAATDDPSSPGRFTFQLTPTHTALLDTLTVRWTTSNLGTVTTVVEVAGGFVFSLADIRALAPLNDTTRYPTPVLHQMRVLVEQSLEDACGRAFVPRYTRETVSGDRASLVSLRHPEVRAVRSITVAGTAYGTAELGDVAFTPTGALTNTRGYFPYGVSNVTVGYEFGPDFPPERVRRAAVRLARRWLVEGPVDDRATAMSTDDGTFQLVTPGRRGDLFDIPEVNAVVQQYQLTPMVA